MAWSREGTAGFILYGGCNDLIMYVGEEGNCFSQALGKTQKLKDWKSTFPVLLCCNCPALKSSLLQPFIAWRSFSQILSG